MVSTVAKHAKTVDFEAFIDLLRATVPVVSAVTGADSKKLREEIDTVGGVFICGVLTNIEKKC